MVKGDQSDNVREEQGSGKVHYTKAEMVQMVEMVVRRVIVVLLATAHQRRKRGRSQMLQPRYMFSRPQ